MSIRKSDEDLFEESRMSFGEHLEELRKVLLKAVIGLGIGCVVGFFFANRVVDFLTVPLDKALRKFEKNQAVAELKVKSGYLPPELEPWLEDNQLAPRQVMVDPGHLVRALRRVSPGFLAEVDLTPYQFRPENLKPDAVSALCKQLSKSGKSNADELSGIALRQHRIWALLDEADRPLVDSLAKSKSPDEDQVVVFTDALNRVLDRPELHEAPAFSGLLTRKETSFWDNFRPPNKNTLPDMYQTWKDNGTADLSRRINRILVVSQFPESFVPLKLDMVPLEIWEDTHVKPQSLTATEPFMIWLKAGLISGLIIASPWILYQLWSFVASGLYGHERKYVYLYMPISMLLFIAGVCLAFLFVFEPVLDFLFTFNSQMGISPIPRVSDWLSFVMFLPLGFGIAFQLPLLMLFMNRIGVVAVETYTASWRVAVLIIFFLSMVLTPADPISMMLLAGPLTLLYFLGIGMCNWMPGGGRNPFESELQPGI